MSLYSIKVRFMCKSCRTFFKYVDQFIAHKLEKHLIQFDKIKSIVFEESVFQHCLLPSVSSTTTTTETQESTPTPIESHNKNLFNTTSTVTASAQANIYVLPDSEIYSSPLSKSSTTSSDPSASSKSDPVLLTNIVVKHDTPFSIDGEEDQPNSFETESEPATTGTGNNGKDDLDPLDLDHAIETTNVKCEISEFNFESENDGDNDADGSSNTSNFRLVDDPPNIALADSLSQPFHYKQSNVNIISSDLHLDLAPPLPSSLPVSLEVFGYHTQNSDAYIEVDDRGNRHFKFPSSQQLPDQNSNSNSSTAAVEVQNSYQNHCITFYNSNNGSKQQSRSELHSRPVESSSRSNKRTFRQSTRERPYKCEVPNCDSAFSLPYSLNYHMKSKHSEDSHLKRFSCEICQRSFYSKGEVVKHGVVHTDERPFRCHFEGCTATYKRKNKLTLHLQLNHTDS